MKMKAISLWQPWASAIPLGLKGNETRSWYTKYRGPLAIHAAKTKKGLNDPNIFSILQTLKMYGADIKQFPLGCFVATAEIIDCINIPEPELGFILLLGQTAKRDVVIGSCEFLLGDYTSGRYAWILDNVQSLKKPIPAKGYQGLWDVDIQGGINL